MSTRGGGLGGIFETVSEHYGGGGARGAVHSQHGTVGANYSSALHGVFNVSLLESARNFLGLHFKS